MSKQTLLPDAQSIVLMFLSLLSLGPWRRLPDLGIELMAGAASPGAGAAAEAEQMSSSCFHPTYTGVPYGLL